MEQHCENGKGRLTPIFESVPENLVKIGGHYIGKEKRIEGKYFHNRIWVESSHGEGCFIPLTKVEKLIAEEFLRCF